MKNILVVATIVFFSNLNTAHSCATDQAKTSKIPRSFGKDQRSIRKPSDNSIPHFAKQNLAPNWEARLANLMLDQLGTDSSVISISIPFVIQGSNYYPYGDGQSNSKMVNPTSWDQPEFPAIGFEKVLPNGTKVRSYKFAQSLHIQTYSETVTSDQLVKTTPTGWNDSFYFSFQTSVIPISKFLGGIPASYRTFSGNRVAPNPALIPANSNAAEQIRNGKLGASYNSAPAWYSDNVHGRFPNQNGQITAVGGVITRGITDLRNEPFKQLYNCFDSRDLASEDRFGVPSGSGWHQVGDPAETILNNLGAGKFPVAIARTHHQSNAAYGLTEVITATFISKNAAFITNKGESHWYVNQNFRPACVEIWVHPKVPSLSNSWGFKK